MLSDFYHLPDPELAWILYQQIQAAEVYFQDFAKLLDGKIRNQFPKAVDPAFFYDLANDRLAGGTDSIVDYRGFGHGSIFNVTER